MENVRKKAEISVKTSLHIFYIIHNLSYWKSNDNFDTKAASAIHHFSFLQKRKKKKVFYRVSRSKAWFDHLFKRLKGHMLWTFYRWLKVHSDIPITDLFSQVWETPQLMHEGLFSMSNGLPESLFKAHRCGSGGTLFTRHWENFERMFTVSVWYCAVIKELKQASMPKELIDKRFHD